MRGPCGVSVLSWNILAPIFVRCPAAPYTWFEWCRDEDIEWSSRRHRIQEMLLRLDADVLILQEVQYPMEGPGSVPTAPEWFGEVLQRVYALQMPEFSIAEWDHQLDRNVRAVGSAAVTGNGTLWKKALFDKVAVDTTSRALVVALQLKETGEVFSFANVHLEGHPDATDMRQRQMATAVKKGRKRASHLVVAGDFNQADDLTSQTGLSRVPTDISWCNGKTALSIDHITIDAASLRVEAVRRDIYTDRRPIPNEAIPSDHAPIVCTLSVCGPPPGGVSAPKTPGEGLAPTTLLSIRSQYEALVLTAPPPIRGKPNAEQLEALQSFAMRKKVFLAQFVNDGDEHSFAKALLDKKIK